MNDFDDADAPDSRSIAIVGIAGRFPGCRDLDDFWRVIAEGTEVMREFDDRELEAAGVGRALRNDPRYVRRGTALEDVDAFDAEFFGLSPREAEVVDPQQRIFLECAWEAMEHAGYAPGSLDVPVGVYAGTGMNGYLITRLLRDRRLLELVGGYQVMVGNDKDFLCTRTSYKLDLKGPSVTVQTACSTSLVAVQMACQALLDGECDMALAGGVAVPYPGTSGHLYLEGMIFSPDGKCRPFDAQAKGTRAGAGCGIVVLKRLAEAIADGDTIHAVIRGAAVNNDGSAKAGYTAPSVDGQVEVIATAQVLAGVEARSVGYVEAHGTGTVLGDPIEVAALRRVFAEGGDDVGYCRLGSLKANIGHLDVAAGVAGLIKAVLVLKHATFPPLVNFEKPNPLLELASSPFTVPTRAEPWPATDTPRRAGVSSFGIGGTNAHVVLEEWRESRPAAGDDDGPQLLVLSARSEAALEASARLLADRLDRGDGPSLVDTAWTLQVGRRAFAHRLALVAQDRAEAVAALRGARRGAAAPRVHEGGERPVAFLFSGQGSQYAGMGSGLYERFATFREIVDRCAEAARAGLGADLREVMLDAGRADIVETRIAQPALFAFEVALARQWMAWGVEPVALLGHSIGEFAAAHVAGVLSLEDAIALVVERGRLMQAMPAGAMAAVQWGEEPLRDWLTRNAPGVEIAAINAPTLCAIAGESDAVSAVCRGLEAMGVESRTVRTSHAFHSASMDGAMAPFERAVARTTLSAPSIRYVSNLSGRWITDTEAVSPVYYARHLRGTVRFADGVRTIAQDPSIHLLEIGPGDALASISRAVLGADGNRRVTASGTGQRRPDAEARAVAEAAGRLWAAGARIDWTAMRGAADRRRVPLPTYPFQRMRFDPPAPQTERGQDPSAPLRREDVRDFFHVPTWTRTVARAGSVRAPSTWAVVGGDVALSGELVSRLSREGARAQAFDTVDEAVARRGDWCPSGAGVRGAILLDTLAADGLELPPRDRFDGPISLAAAMSVTADAPARLIVVTRGAVSVLDERVLDPDAAFAWGPVLALPTEMPGLAARLVDVDGDASAAAQAVCAEALGSGDERLVAHRGRRRWVRRFEALPLEAVDPRDGPIPEGGVVLVTGGLGGMGLAVARRLAERRGARLLLTGRTPLPAREGWDDWLRTHGPTDRVAVAIRGVREVEALGGEVIVAAADAADESAMRAAIDRARAQWGAIDAVVHAAGVAGAGRLSVLKAPGDLEAVCAPKVDGLRVLAKLLGDTPLKSIVLASSFNADFAAPGLADYAAANTWLGAFAESDRWPAAWPTATCIDWGAWRETGMAANLEIPEHRRAAWNAYLAESLGTDEALDALERAMASGVPRLMVLPFDPARLAAAAAAAAAPEHPRAGAEAASVPVDYDASGLQTDAQRQLAAIWAELLGVDRVAPEDNFIDLGGHSLLVMQAIAHIERRIGLKLPPQRLMLETLAELAADAADGGA